MRKGGEYLERTFAHCYDTGGMRRTHLRGHANILKRLLIHVGGFNLGLVMRSLFGIGKPRGLQGGLGGFSAAVLRYMALRIARWVVSWRHSRVSDGVIGRRRLAHTICTAA